MKIEIHHIRRDPDVRDDIVRIMAASIRTFKELLMATQVEVTQTLREVLAQQQKTASEISTVQTLVTDLNLRVEELQALLDAGDTGGSVTQELLDAVNAVKAQAQAIDDAIPDVPAPPAEPVPPAEPTPA